MDVEQAEARTAAIAAAIGEPARTRMLLALLGGRAHTSTELAAIAGVAPSTASLHLRRLLAADLVAVAVQGRHRYYRLRGPEVAAALEALSVLSGAPTAPVAPRTPHRLRAARTCYDHLAGALGVALHDRLLALRWLRPSGTEDGAYDLTPAGERSLTSLGLDPDAVRNRRRRFAFACLDWSERRPHLAGALAAAVLDMLITRRWLSREPGDRALVVTATGRRELRVRLGMDAGILE